LNQKFKLKISQTFRYKFSAELYYLLDLLFGELFNMKLKAVFTLAIILILGLVIPSGNAQNLVV